MTNQLLLWTIYEITTKNSKINGVMFRGRIRKLGIEKSFDVLVENAEDAENCVRFAVLHRHSAKIVSDYVHNILNDAQITLTLESVANPVLSKIKVNETARYEL